MAMTQQKKLLLSLGVMAGVAVAASAYAYFTVFQGTKAEAEREDEEAKLFALPTSELRTLRVTAKGETTTLERRGDRWHITAPVDAEVDVGAVDGLLHRLSSARRTKVLLEDAGLEAFGLEPASILIEGESADGSSAYVAFGARNEFDNSIYASTRPGQVLTAESSLRTAFEKTTFDLRNKQILRFSDESLGSIEVSGSSEYAVEQRGGVWYLRGEDGERADDEVMTKLRRALREIRATDFPAALPESADPEKPELVVVLSDTDGTRRSLRLYAAEESAFAQVEGGPLAEVPDGIFDDLRLSVDQLRDQRILPVEADEVARLSFVDGDSAFVAEREASGERKWKLVEPREAAVTQWKLNSALSTLTGLRPESVVENPGPLADYGLDAARAVRLHGADGAVLETLLLGKEEGSHTYAMREGAPTIYEVRTSRVSGLPKKIEDVEDASAAKADE